MSNKKKATEILECSKCTFRKEMENQEQSLLWTLYSILDGLAVEGEARDYAINEFKKHLEYYKGD